MKNLIYQPKGILVIICLLLITSVTTKAQEKSLYERLGGYDAISAVDDF